SGCARSIAASAISASGWPMPGRSIRRSGPRASRSTSARPGRTPTTAAEEVDSATRAATEQVYFGATVTYANGRGEERTIKIVGVDEVALDKGHVSWISPIAKELLRAEGGGV